MHRLLVTVVAAAAVALPSTALAAPASLPPLKRTLTAKSGSGTCAVQRNAGSRGVSAFTYKAPMSGFVRTKLDGLAADDWDLAIYDARNHARLATSEAFGSHEVADTWVTAGQRLRIQSCLREGKPRAARLALTFYDIAPPKTDGVAKLITVHYRNGGELTRLADLGLDVTHDVQPGAAQVAVYSAKQLALLNNFTAKLGLKTEVKIADLTADSQQARAADIHYAQATAASPLPSGRTTYRVLSDYQNELKQIVAAYGGAKDLARPLTLGKTSETREMQGVELASHVSGDDGRPTFLLVAVHHAREWPAGEAAMEYAWMLAKGYGTDARITKLLDNERVVIVPLINVDGFVVSRTDSQFSPNDIGNENGIFKPGEDPGETVHTGEAVAPGGPPAAYRRKNCEGNFPAGFPCEFQHGVDNNRNYGQGWGGPGASTDPSSQTYRGTGPWSTPESAAVWHYSQKHNITNLITLHNVAALVLRPPGLASAGFAPDEDRMKQIGDQMADDTGYTSEFGWQLYDTSGTTEDWTYAAQASYGYTIEIGPEGGQFHLPYQGGVVNEWTGGGKRPGLREALMVAAEAAANPADHSTIQGSAPAGRVLRLHKSFKTATGDRGQVCGFADPSIESGICQNKGPNEQVPDVLDYKTTVPASGHYAWSVSPSTRPFVAEHREIGALQKVGSQHWDGTMPADRSPAEIPFTVDRSDLFRMTIDLEYDPACTDDLDLYIYWKDPVTNEYRQVASSAGPAGSCESAVLIQPRPGQYKAVIDLFAAPPATPYHVTRTDELGSIKITRTGITEAYTMTCETPDGKVLESKQVTVDRGQAVTADFACDGSNAGDNTYAQQGRQHVLGARSGAGRLVISKRKVRLTKRGYARIRVVCVGGPCRGRLALRTLKRYARASRKTRVALGSKRYALKRGQRAVVRVKVSKRARRVINRHKRVRALARAGTAHRTITVVAASRG